MSVTEIKYRKRTLIFYLVLTLVGGIAIGCGLLFMDAFSGQKIQIAGTTAALLLLIASWNYFRRIQTNPTVLLITSEKIGFYKGRHLKEIPFNIINAYNFENFYNGQEYVRQLRLELITGEQELIELNGLDTNQETLERILNEKKRW
jgi:hypothetical protein